MLFFFGNVTVASLDMMEIALDTTPNVSKIPVFVDKVLVDVPELHN